MLKHLKPIDDETWEKLRDWKLVISVILENGERTQGTIIGRSGISIRPIVQTKDGRQYELKMFTTTFEETKDSKKKWAKR